MAFSLVPEHVKSNSRAGAVTGPEELVPLLGKGWRE